MKDEEKPTYYTGETFLMGEVNVINESHSGYKSPPNNDLDMIDTSEIQIAPQKNKNARNVYQMKTPNFITSKTQPESALAALPDRIQNLEIIKSREENLEEVTHESEKQSIVIRNSTGVDSFGDKRMI